MSDDEPRLGLASTEELLREAIARFTITYPHDATGTYLNTHRALTIAEMIGGMNAHDREYRTAS